METYKFEAPPPAEIEVDPINDIIDYLVRCAKISFKNPHVNESEVRTSEKVRMAHQLFNNSPIEFLMQFGKYLAPYHVEYFEKFKERSESYRACVEQLKVYHSDVSRHKRVRNRRFKALQKMQKETDYFSDKQMMYRNPLLYEQLVGQYLTDDEVRHRDRVDDREITFLNLVLDTVDHNYMRETKNEQMLDEEGTESDQSQSQELHENETTPKSKKQWGDFETPDTTPSYMPEVRKQNMINAVERNLLREEFLQEMYSSFLEGRDAEVDYPSIDNDEQFDDIQQLSQDAEDKYFDSEPNDVNNLEEHMKLVEAYGRKNSNHSVVDDPLDEFMEHITNKI